MSLLTADYKILAKILANKIASVLASVVHLDQTCSVPGRSIRDKCRLLQDVIDFCDAVDRPAALVNLDQKKAFDRVSSSLGDGILQRFNFGPYFCRCVKCLYLYISFRVIINGCSRDVFIEVTEYGRDVRCHLFCLSLCLRRFLA